MAVRLKQTNGSRQQTGAAVLDAARATDTRLVKDRLRRFEEVHRTFLGAQRRVDAAEEQLGIALAHLTKLDGIQDEAVETLARSLVTDGQARTNPFAVFGGPAPGTLMRLPLAEEAAAIHQLVTVVTRSGASEATKQAAEAADKAADDVEEVLGSIGKLEDGVRTARRFRDTVGKTWDLALLALRRVARAAAAEGAPELYTKLFPRPTRVSSKTKTAESAPAQSAPPESEKPPAATNAA